MMHSPKITRRKGFITLIAFILDRCARLAGASFVFAIRIVLAIINIVMNRRVTMILQRQPIHKISIALLAVVDMHRRVAVVLEGLGVDKIFIAVVAVGVET